MSLKLIPPGRRRGNQYYLVRGRIDGRLYEVVAQPPTTDARVAAAFRDRLATAIRERSGVVARPQTFAEAVDAYVAARRPSRNDTRYLARLKEHFGRRALDSIGNADILKAAHELYPGASPATKNRQAVVPAAAVLHLAAQDGWCAYRRVRKLDEAMPAPRRVSRADMERLIRLADDSDLRRLLVILAYQGWRISEAVAAEWARVDLRRRTITVWIPKARAWKEVPMHPAVCSELRRVPKASRKGRLLRWATTAGPRKALRALTKRAGIEFTPHCARHAFASDLNERGATESDILALSTWTSHRSIARYTSISGRHARDTLSLLDARSLRVGKNVGKRR